MIICRTGPDQGVGRIGRDVQMHHVATVVIQDISEKASPQGRYICIEEWRGCSLVGDDGNLRRECRYIVQGCHLDDTGNDSRSRKGPRVNIDLGWVYKQGQCAGVQAQTIQAYSLRTGGGKVR